MLIHQLLKVYYASPAYTGLSLSSRATYTARLNNCLHLFPAKHIDEYTAEDADKLYADLKAEFGVHKAVSVCVIIRRVWNYAVRYRLTITNPFAKMGLDKLDSREQIWTPDNLEAFYNGCKEYKLTSLITLAQLCYYLAQRPGDMRMLKWSDYHDHSIRFVQQKTGRRMVSHVDPELQEYLATLPRNHEYIVVSERTGKPYTKFDYSKLAKQVMEHVGLHGLQIRDLRRTGVTEAAEAGLSDSELLALNGNTSRSTLNTYQVRTEKLNQSATAKRFGREVA